MVQRPSTWRNRDAAPFAPAVPVLAWARSDAPPLAKGGRLWARAPYSTTVTQVARTGCREVRHSRWRMAQMESTPTSTSCFGSKGGSVVRSARSRRLVPIERDASRDFRRRVLAAQRRVLRPSRPSVRPQIPVERGEFIVHGECLPWRETSRILNTEAPRCAALVRRPLPSECALKSTTFSPTRRA